MTSQPDLLEERLRSALGSHYTIDRELGGGGMARVFVATETRLDRRVVVKVLPPDAVAGVSIERFQREIMMAARLQNPHIVPVLTAGDADGLPFFTMPLVEGESLRALLGRRIQLPLTDELKILRDVASALAYAHERGIVHRDIKPDNILVSSGSAMVTDFGVAKALSSAKPDEATSTLTETGASLGTPAYMAPEQILGDDIDGRTDIYAWGVVAYELLTRAHPFADRKSAQALIAAHLTERPVSIAKRRPDLPHEVAEVVMRSLEKKREQRPVSADHICRTLDVSAPRRGSFSNRKIVAAFGGGVTALLLLASFLLLKKSHAAGGSTEGATSINSIAVLPFSDLSPNKDQDYFAEGIAEELTTVLSKVEGLRVAARTSAFAFKGKEAQNESIRQKLNVGAILEGSIRKSGDRLRVTAQLVDARNGYALWSDHYDRKESDVFAVEDELAASIANALKLRLSFSGANNPAVVRTQDVEAYNLYLRGRYFWNRRTAVSALKAIGFFEQAIARDPSFTLAHAALAEGYIILPGYANVDPPVAFAKAKAEAERALAVDSTLPGARAALALYFVFGPHDEETAGREFRRSILLNPDYATAHHWYGLYFAVRGDADSAVAELARAQTLDPLSLIINTQYGQSLYLARRFPDAIAQGRRTIELDSTFVRGHRDLAWSYIVTGKFADAEREFRETLRLVGDPPGREMAYLYAVSGRKDEARALIASVDAAERSGKEGRRYGIEYSAPVEIACVYAALGDKAKAFEWLDRARAAHMFLGYPRLDPRYDPLRSDPRFGALLR